MLQRNLSNERLGSNINTSLNQQCAVGIEVAKASVLIYCIPSFEQGSGTHQRASALRTPQQPSKRVASVKNVPQSCPPKMTKVST